MKFFKLKKNKAPANDFTPKDLPRDRFQLLGDILKHNLWKVVGFNGLYTMFLLPLLIVGFITLTMVAVLNTNDALFPRFLPFIADPNHFVSVGESFFNEGMSAMNPIWTFVLSLAVTLTIAGPAKAALYYVMRNLSWGEYNVSYSDFWKAFKANWKQGLFFNFVTALMYILLFYAFFFYGGKYAATGTVFYQYAMWIVGIIFAFFCMMKTFFFPQLVTYKLKISQIIKNSFIFSVLQMIKVIPIAIIPLVLMVIGLAFNQLYIGVFIYIFIGYAFVALVNMIFSNFIFDKYVNDLVPGATKRRGMSPDTNPRKKKIWPKL